jgi:hypothetical protein
MGVSKAYQENQTHKLIVHTRPTDDATSSSGFYKKRSA